MEEMRHAKINSKIYGRLLAKVLPVTIETEEENERMAAYVDKLLEKEALSPEEEKLLDLMSTLIEAYEEKHYPIPDAPPHAVLQMLMEDRELRQTDLLEIFGHRSVVSEALSGKRAITKEQAKLLSQFFGVPRELFV